MACKWCHSQKMQQAGDSSSAACKWGVAANNPFLLGWCVAQVDLTTACMRPGATRLQLATLQQHVLSAVAATSAPVQVHTGTW